MFQCSSGFVLASVEAPSPKWFSCWLYLAAFASTIAPINDSPSVLNHDSRKIQWRPCLQSPLCWGFFPPDAVGPCGLSGEQRWRWQLWILSSVETNCQSFMAICLRLCSWKDWLLYSQQQYCKIIRLCYILLVRSYLNMFQRSWVLSTQTQRFSLCCASS